MENFHHFFKKSQSLHKQNKKNNLYWLYWIEIWISNSKKVKRYAKSKPEEFRIGKVSSSTNL